MLQNSQYFFNKNLTFKKFQRVLENVLAGTFLSTSSGLATFGIMSLIDLFDAYFLTCRYFEAIRKIKIVKKVKFESWKTADISPEN